MLEALTLNLALKLVAFIIVWVIVSIPMYIASKLMDIDGLAQAMLASLTAPLCSLIVYNILSFVFPINVIVAIILWFITVKIVYDCGWGDAIILTILTILITLLIILILEFLGLTIFRVLGIPIPFRF